MDNKKRNYSDEYKSLLSGLQKYGTKAEEMILQAIGVEAKKIQRRVILAPWWEPEVFGGLGKQIEFLSRSTEAAVKVWEINFDAFKVTYIKTGIGAPVLTDVLLALGLTDCEKVIFVGSVGALDIKMGIGDIVIPEFSICGDGVSRYLKGEKLEENDVFGEKSFPNSEIFMKIKASTEKHCSQSSIAWHLGKTFSIDTIFAQFAYLDKIIEMGCNTIEMETAAAFRAAIMADIQIGALFSVSDNSIFNKSLYSGRTDEDQQYRKKVRREVFPKIILDVLK